MQQPADIAAKEQVSLVSFCSFQDLVISEEEKTPIHTPAELWILYSPQLVIRPEMNR